MDLNEYINNQRNSFKRQTESIIDYSVFDFSHVPDKPLIRAEAKKIIHSLVRYEKTGIPTNQVVFGSRGSGKTLTLKYLSSLLEKDSVVKLLYANVRYYSTSFKILAHMLGKSSRGTSLAELYARFRATHKSHTAIILDEVHLWAPKEKQRELLYFLSRDNRNFLIIMLSNDPRFLSEIDQSVRSTLQPELIHFQNYSADEIASILTDRAKRGLKWPAISIVRKIAAYTVKEANSDCPRWDQGALLLGDPR